MSGDGETQAMQVDGGQKKRSAKTSKANGKKGAIINKVNRALEKVDKAFEKAHYPETIYDAVDQLEELKKEAKKLEKEITDNGFDDDHPVHDRLNSLNGAIDELEFLLNEGLEKDEEVGDFQEADDRRSSSSSSSRPPPPPSGQKKKKKTAKAAKKNIGASKSVSSKIGLNISLSRVMRMMRADVQNRMRISPEAAVVVAASIDKAIDILLDLACQGLNDGTQNPPKRVTPQAILKALQAEPDLAMIFPNFFIPQAGAANVYVNSTNQLVEERILRSRKRKRQAEEADDYSEQISM